MPRPIRNFDIYLPLEDNKGEPFAESTFVSLQRELLKRFEGVTSNQREYPLHDLWRSGARFFQDRIVVFSVMAFHTKGKVELIRYLERLKTRLKKEFDQLEVLITLQELLAI